MTDNKSLTITFKKLDEKATVPTKGSVGSAGWDLYATTSGTVPAGERLLIKTGLALTMPSHLYGRIAPRSGLAYKKGIQVMAGVIDSDYTGDIGVILFNSSKADFDFTPDKAIAQLIFEMHCINVVMVEATELEATDRGDGGFGSTDTLTQLTPEAAALFK